MVHAVSSYDYLLSYCTAFFEAPSPHLVPTFHRLAVQIPIIQHACNNICYSVTASLYCTTSCKCNPELSYPSTPSLCHIFLQIRSYVPHSYLEKSKKLWCTYYIQTTQNNAKSFQVCQEIRCHGIYHPPWSFEIPMNTVVSKCMIILEEPNRGSKCSQHPFDTAQDHRIYKATSDPCTLHSHRIAPNS